MTTCVVCHRVDKVPFISEIEITEAKDSQTGDMVMVCDRCLDKDGFECAKCKEVCFGEPAYTSPPHWSDGLGDSFCGPCWAKECAWAEAWDKHMQESERRELARCRRREMRRTAAKILLAAILTASLILIVMGAPR